MYTATKIDTARYTRSTRKNPSGLSAWVFEFSTANGAKTLMTSSMTWASAKKWAISQAKELGAVTVQVLP